MGSHWSQKTLSLLVTTAAHFPWAPPLLWSDLQRPAVQGSDQGLCGVAEQGALGKGPGAGIALTTWDAQVRKKGQRKDSRIYSLGKSWDSPSPHCFAALTGPGKPNGEDSDSHFPRTCWLLVRLPRQPSPSLEKQMRGSVPRSSPHAQRHTRVPHSTNRVLACAQRCISLRAACQVSYPSHPSTPRSPG